MTDNVTLSQEPPITVTRNTGFFLRGWVVVIFQAILFWLGAGAVTHGLNITLPELSRTYNLDYNTLLALATPASWASIPAGPITAWLCEKKGAKFNVILCLVVCGLCYGFLGYADSFAAFTILFACVCFFGTGFAYVGGTAIVTSWFVKKSGLALGWCSVGQTFSSAFYVPVLATCFALFGVSNGFWCIAVMMLVMAVLVTLFIFNHPEDIGMTPDNEVVEKDIVVETDVEPTADLQGSLVNSSLSVKRMLGMKDVWLMGIGTGAIYILLVGVVSQIVPRLINTGYSMNDAIFFMSISAIFGALGAFGWGWLNQKLGIKPAIMLYTVWWMVAIVFNIYADNVVAMWISMLMIGFSLPGATNYSTALIATKFPRKHYIRAIGIIHPIQSIIRCLSFSILAFGLSYLGGYSGAYVMFVAIGAVTLVLFWLTDVTPITVQQQ